MARQTRRCFWFMVIVGLTGSLPAAPGTSPAAGLVSYWNFESSLDDLGFLYTSGTGAASDNLTAQVGTARFVAGKVGKAVAIGALAGDPAWLNAPSSADVDLPGTYTIEAWIYPTLFDQDWQRLVLRWQGQFSFHFALRLVGGAWMVSIFHQQAGGANVNADGGSAVLNAWQHVAAVADGQFVRVYLNGTEVKSVAYDGTIKQGTGVGLGVGDMAGGDGLRYNGYIDELAIWKVALTPAEILSHYEAGADGYGLTLTCEEELEAVSIAGPTLASVGESVELTAELLGVDEGRTASYAWTLVSGDATLGATDGRTLTVTPNAVGIVQVAVAAGDGLCFDLASARHSLEAVPAGGPGTSPASGLVSYYRFDGSPVDNGADFIHHSGVSADNLTARGGADRFVPGIIGQAAAIGVGVGDTVWYNTPVSADVALPATYTIESWIYPTDLTGAWQRLALRWGTPLSYHFALRLVGASWTVSLFHGQAVAGTPNADGGNVVLRRWQHVAGIADGTMIRTYLNGVEVASAPYDGTIGGGGAEGLGLADSFAGNSGMSFNGLVDEFAMWNVALTPAQVLSHYQAGRAGYGLIEGCLEDVDTVTISGLRYGAAGETLELRASMAGVDAGRTATYAWEIVSGVASLGPTSGETLSVTLGDAGFVEVRVSAGDGACDDIAVANHTMQVLPAGNPGASPESGLVSYWDFEGTLVDNGVLFTSSAGTANDDLTARQGAARHVPGVVGDALALGELAGDPLWLDGVSTPDVDLPATYTIEAWIFPTELSDSWQRLVLRWGGVGRNSYHFSIRNNTGFVNAVSLFHAQSSGVEVNADGGTVLPNQWQHVAGVADGTMVRVYLNGIEVAATPYDGTIVRGTGEGLGIGDSATALSTIRFNGLLDELAMWNVALTPAEILSHYQAGVSGYGLDAAPPIPQLSGDCNQDGARSISDIVCQVGLLFQGFNLLDRAVQLPPCPPGGLQSEGNLSILDVNGDGKNDVSDVVHLAQFLFLGGPAPAPGLECFGTSRRLGCPEDPGCP
jgi:hypothetical protein